MRGRLPEGRDHATVTRRRQAAGVPGLLLESPIPLDTSAQAAFDVAAHDLAAAGTVRDSDAYALALWASLVSAATRALAQLADHPDPGGAEAKRLRTTAANCTDRAIRIAGELGLSPVSRARVGIAQVHATSLLSMFEDADD